MRHVLGALCGAALLLGAGTASAQFPKAGTLSFGADRLTGIYFFGRSGLDYRVMGLGAPPGGNVASQARFAFDGFVTDGLSLGGSLAIWDTDIRSNGFRASGTTVMLAPRIGYAIEFNDTFGFWPRGGPVILTADTGDADTFSLTFEAAFYGMAGKSWGFTFGPTADFGLDGPGRTRDKTLGLISAGIFGWI